MGCFCFQPILGKLLCWEPRSSWKASARAASGTARCVRVNTSWTNQSIRCWPMQNFTVESTVRKLDSFKSVNSDSKKFVSFRFADGQAHEHLGCWQLFEIVFHLGDVLLWVRYPWWHQIPRLQPYQQLQRSNSHWSATIKRTGELIRFNPLKTGI